MIAHWLSMSSMPGQKAHKRAAPKVKTWRQWTPTDVKALQSALKCVRSKQQHSEAITRVAETLGRTREAIKSFIQVDRAKAAENNAANNAAIDAAEIPSWDAVHPDEDKVVRDRALALSSASEAAKRQLCDPQIVAMMMMPAPIFATWP